MKSKGKELYAAVARHMSSLGMKSTDIFGLAIQIGKIFFSLSFFNIFICILAFFFPFHGTFRIRLSLDNDESKVAVTICCARKTVVK